MSSWVHHSLRVSDFIAPTATMRVHVRTVDANPGHLVEAGFDKFLINEGPTGINETTEQLVHLSAAPNPFNESVSIHYQIPASEQSVTGIELTDITGRRVAYRALASSEGIVVFTESLTPGVYLVRLVGNKHVQAPLKLVKVK